MRVTHVVASLAVFAVMACGGDAPPPAAPPDTRDPTPIGTGTVGRSGAGGEGGAGGAAGVGGAAGASGACANDADIDAFSFAASGREVARQCVVSVCGGTTFDSDEYEDCVSNCVGLRVRGLSSSCASCYGAASRCELDAGCANRCRVGICATECTGCLRNGGCLTALDECTGIPDDACAP